MVLLLVIAISFQGPLLEDSDNSALLEGMEVGQRPLKLARSKPTHHAYLLWSIPRCPRGRVWHCMAARGISCKGSCFYGRNESRKRSCFTEPRLIHSLLAAFLQGICSEQKNRDLQRHPRDWDAELLSYISKDCTLKSQSASGNLCIIVHIRLLFFSVYLFQFWRLFF